MNSSCEVSALRINNIVEHGLNFVLESLKNYYLIVIVSIVLLIS